MTSRKFFKTTFTVTVLHEESVYTPDDLNVVHQDITDGDYCGTFEQHNTIEIDGKQAASELVRMASDPYWFNLDEDGNDVEQ
jgi:hypothetical protein